MTKTRCSATTAAGRPCRAWAVRGSSPPRCAPHGGGERPVGAPTGNKNAERHGFYSADPEEVSINDAIADLTDKMNRLDGWIRAREEAARDGRRGNGELSQLFAIYTQASSRLARMLRDRRALSGEAADGISGALAVALDELATEMGLVGEE